jgi:hypothetical protein
MEKVKNKWWVYVVVGVVLILGIIGIIGRFTFLGYYWTSIGDQSIGVETVAGNVTRVLPPGIHTNQKLWADLYEVDISQLAWCGVDPEVLTKDSQRLGFVVCGTVQRPTLADFIGSGTERTTFYQYNGGQYWVGYKQYFLNNSILAGKHHTETNPKNPNEQLYVIDEAGLMQQLAQQAMKSCVGDRTFEEAVVGSNRDSLRSCIDESVSTLAANYGGLKVENVVVPNILIGEEVAAKLDAITQAKFDTQFELQKEEQAIAEGRKLLAIEQAAIRTQQGSVQEMAKQEAITLELQTNAERAREELIRVQKANELLEAQLQVQISQTKLEDSKIEVQSKYIWEITLAELMMNNPVYAEYLMLQLATAAWDETDKIVVPIGSDPYTIINPWGNVAPLISVE